jgi:uncharacterized protein YndB with AHSA1/START domain
VSESDFKPKTVYVTYVAGAAERVWGALTSAKFTKHYFFGRSIESEWNVGSPVTYRLPDGSVDIFGTVVRCDPPKTLCFTWNIEWREHHAGHAGKSLEELRSLPECLVTFQLDDLGGVVRLTMTESHQFEPDEKLLEGGRRGWPMILSGLKTLVETSQPLPKFDFTK